MPRISDTVEAPFQGVSQADDTVRLAAQADALLNAYVAIPQGFSKRPPLEYRGILVPTADDPTAEFQWTLIEDKDGDLYILVLDSLSYVRLVNASTLAEVTVTVSPEAETYLSPATDPVNDLRLLSIEDYTFILNRKVPVALDPATAPTRPFEAIVWIKLSDYGRTYTLTIDGITVTYITPEGDDPDDADDIDTSQIMDRMMNGGTVTPNGSVTPGGGIGASLTTAGFTWSVSGSLLFLSRAADYVVTVKDGLGGTAMVVLKGTTPRFSDLPLMAPTGFTIAVAGANGSNKDDYFVRYDGETWRETIEPGAALGIDPESLPVALVHDQDTDTWSLDTVGWTQREVGNATIVPDPLPVGEALQSIGWFKGRLRLLFSEGALYSGSDSPFRIYPSTLTTGLDSDPIEITNPAEVRAFFKDGTTFDQRDVLFGTGAQAIVGAGSGGLFTVSSNEVAVLGQYPYDGVMAPLKGADNVHFGQQHDAEDPDSYTGVWELNINGPLQRTQGEDLTAALPAYLPQGLVRGASIMGSYASLRFQNESLRAYLHLYRYVGQDRIQSGFSPWELPVGWRWGGVLSKQNTFYIAVWDPSDNLVLCTLNMAAQRTDKGSTRVLTCLDIRMDETQLTVTYDAGLDQTLISAPFSLVGASFSARVGNDPEVYPEGYLLSDPALASTVTWQGDFTGVKFYAGFAYESYWDLSRIYQRDPSTEKPRLEGGALTLKHLIFNLRGLNLLSVRVTNGKRPARTYDFAQTELSDPNNFKGQWTVGIGGVSSEASIRVLNNSHLQCGVLGFTWVGERNLKSQGA